MSVFLTHSLVWKGHCLKCGSFGDADSFHLVLPSSRATVPCVHLRRRKTAGISYGVVFNHQLWRW